MPKLLIILVVIVGTAIGAAAIGILLRHLLGPILRGIFNVIQFIGHLIIELICDVLAATWNLFVAVLLLPAIIGGLLFGRWESVGRMVRGLSSRFRRTGRRVAGLVTRPAGVQPQFKRTPSRTTRQGRRSGEFPGWRLTGELQAGGSGARLLVAEPADGAPDGAPSRVVIKCFDLSGGAPLGQMIRESRALDGAKKLGLVIEHNHDETRFWYVMPFIPGNHLAHTVTAMHTSGGQLSESSVIRSVGWCRDLLATLGKYHDAGFWHKDVKPENIIINDTGAHLVDLGLVTPLQSAMTLTTHGTEYFRDPELVRQALRGSKVSEVDGARFDLYSAGAVLYYMVEGTFPAHGNLSRFEIECGDAIRWVIRRAMADYHKRYATSAEMLADVAFLAASRDPRQVRPADLPSVSASPAPEATPPKPSVGDVHRRPRLEVSDWWSGRYRVRDAVPGAPPSQPDAFEAARRARDSRRMIRDERRQRRSAARRSSFGRLAAFFVGTFVIVFTSIFVLKYADVWFPDPVPMSTQMLPDGKGQVLIVNNHPRRLDAHTAVQAAFTARGWQPMDDIDAEARFRRDIPLTNGLQVGADEASTRAVRAVLNTHDLAGAAIVQASPDDPNAVQVLLLTGDDASLYDLEVLAKAAGSIQSTP
ncbi:MAG: hypothetical protein P8I91_05920 [Phycisphaerales bacterium]|nr:hypothetical protein [Phycisphaerales bacterium]